MIYDREVKNIYAREYQRALRAGASADVASAQARRAVEAHTDRPSKARGRPRDNPRPPPISAAEAERMKYVDHATLTGQLMGDPLPGRSALDLRR